MSMSSLEKLKRVLNSYSSDELYQCLSSYPVATTGISIKNYLYATKLYSVQIKGANYIDKDNEQSNDSYYKIDDYLNMGLAA